MKSVIITGGTGFVGSWLINELIKNNIEVVALVRNKSIASKKIDNSVRFIEYYSDEYYTLIEKKLDIDVFYHLAWEGVSSDSKNNRTVQVSNISFSMEMLEYASKLGVGRFIATGTVAEYTFCDDVMDVDAKQTPNDLYGAAKTATHYLLEIYARQLKMPFNWIVIPSTYGERRRNDNIITYTIMTLLNGEKPRFGNLTQMWDFLYVSEVARALYCIGEKGYPQKTYGIGSGDYRRLREYIEIIRDLINPKLELGIGEIPSMSEKVFSSCVSINDLTNDTGFIPQVTFEDGIRRTIDYYRNNNNLKEE